MIFSPPVYKRLQTRLHKKYRNQFQVTLKRLRKHADYELARWVVDERDLLEDYSSINWFFLHQLNSFLFFLEHQDTGPSAEGSLSKLEEKVFDKWNASEMADVFLKALNEGKSVAEASQKTLRMYEQHLLTLARRHILKQDKTTKYYRPQLSLGEKKVGTKLVRLLESTISMEGKPVSLRTTSLKEMKSISQRVEAALSLIRKFSPDSWERFYAFTEIIIPIRIKEFVSYSHQELPGVSMINVYDRDFVDLMDDLLHENGHHHLNYYLNLGNVIEEPEEAIYYSPWRRTPRPFRGIYHAYFTFFWAFKLFSDLAQGLEEEEHSFTPKEQEKILWRTVEEFRMLEFTFEDLKWAKKKGLISPDGWRLVSEQRAMLMKMKKKITAWERKLKHHKKDLTELKKVLREAQKQFKKS